jgi:aldehyde dehydrogenase (NAD+)
MIATGMEEGARLIAGGPGKPEGFNRGWYVRPTIFADVTNDMAIARQEIFGPVLSILKAEDEGDAIRIANDTNTGSPPMSRPAIPNAPSGSPPACAPGPCTSTAAASAGARPSAATRPQATGARAASWDRGLPGGQEPAFRLTRHRLGWLSTSLSGRG